MMRYPSDEGPSAGQEGRGPGDGGASQAMAGLRPWMGLRDPRIVRVSRSSGGKDRHSKVTTIRGLRDRRVRLSVATALQLYDLQDKLGLGQPSKAVDWLLNAAQHEIDKLPPLQFPPARFMQYSPSIATPDGASQHQAVSSPALAEETELIKENGPAYLTLLPIDRMGDQIGVHKPTQYCSGFPVRARWKEQPRGAMDEKDGFLRRFIEQEGEEVHGTVPLHHSMPCMASNSSSYYHNLEGSNMCVAHVGGYVIPQGEETHAYRPQQLLLCPSAVLPPMFSPYATLPSANNGPKNVNSFHMGSSNS